MKIQAIIGKMIRIEGVSRLILQVVMASHKSHVNDPNTAGRARWKDQYYWNIP